tara:strand:+ start:175 stop:519 length:345 start_codon:yes stop_codon:yes gene_type:complete
MARTKGSQNKFNKSMKDALELAFERSGGVDYLVRVADDDPKTFCGLLGRLIPATVAIAVTHKIDLAAMMQLADTNSQRLNAPDTLEHVQHDTVIVEQVVSDIQPMDNNPMKSKT